MIRYNITEKGRTAESKETVLGKIIELMQSGNGSMTPDEVDYQLDIQGSKQYLEKLSRAGYVSKSEERERSPIGGSYI